MAKVYVIAAIVLLVSSSTLLVLASSDEQFDLSGYFNGYSSSSSKVKTSTSIKMDLSSSSVQLGSTVLVTGTLSSSNTYQLSPVKKATVSLNMALPNGSAADPAKGAKITTDSKGVFKFSYSPADIGQYSLKAVFAGSNTYSGTNSTVSFNATDVQISTMAPVTIQSTMILSGAGITMSGSTEKITGQLRTTAGAAIAGSAVSILVSNPDGTKTGPAGVTTDADGRFSYTVAPSIAGNYVVTATYAGEGSTNGTSATLPFTVTVPTPVKAPTSITLTLTSTSAQTGGNIHADGILAGLVDPSGAIIELSVVRPDGTTVSPTQGATTVTGALGRFSVDYVPTMAGSYELVATFAGDTTSTGSSTSATFTATAPTSTTQTGGSSQTGGSTTQTGGAAPQPSDSNYVVSGNVVKTGSGASAYTGSGATDTIQWAINNCPNGGTVYISAGSYTINLNTLITAGPFQYHSGLIIHNKNIRLQGAGVGQTILTIAAGQLTTYGEGFALIIADGFDGLVIDGMTLDGNRANNQESNYDGAALIYTWGYQYNPVFSNLELRNSPTCGMYLGNNGGNGASGPGTSYPGYTVNAHLLNIRSHDNYYVSFLLDSTLDTFMENIVSENDGTAWYVGMMLAGLSTDPQGNDNNLVASNITMHNSDLWLSGLRNAKFTNLVINNPDLNEPTSSLVIRKCDNVDIGLTSLVRNTATTWMTYGIGLRASNYDVRIDLASKIVARVCIAALTEDGVAPSGNVAVNGGTLQATDRGISTAGTLRVTASSVYFDVPSAGYNLYVGDTSAVTAASCSAARTTQTYVASGATLTKTGGGTNL